MPSAPAVADALDPLFERRRVRRARPWRRGWPRCARGSATPGASTTCGGDGRGDARVKRRATRLRLDRPAGAAHWCRALAVTWRFEEVNAEPWRALRAAGKPFIFALWHGHLLAQTWLRRSRGDHGDDQRASRWRDHRRLVERGGIADGAWLQLPRGRAALLGMVRELESGKEFAITPDGPRGPAGQVAPGVLLASQSCQVPDRDHAERGLAGLAPGELGPAS
jgi:hypothetical protein